jgi:tetratricopeptide (TPR) repeat protein
MKHSLFSYLLLFCQIIFLVTLSACSQESNGVVSKAYHNTTAHYNAYYLAREKLAEMETELFKSRKDDYNQLLDIIIPIDSNIANAQQTNTEYVMQKASLPVQRHKNSKWIDDSYLLVGTAQFYQLDFPNALKAFKYVNSVSKNDDARHEALIGIFRTYVQDKEYSNAKSVVSFIRKENLSKQNLAEFYLIRAQLHKEEQEHLQAVGTLALAAPLMKKGERKARVHYIMGQLYQLLNNQQQAYKNFRATLKNNPTYELAFNARLNMLQAYQVKKKEDDKKAISYFRKMLRDEKNVDYKDKIYYQMGLFEARQKRYEPAITYLKKSTEATSSDPIQKPYTFLKLGEIYFENLQQYELAKAYYDSTVLSLPASAPDFEKITRRQKVLDEFVQNLTIIQTEDSLQRLAKMDTASLSKLLDENFAREQQERLALERKRNREQNADNGQQENNAFDQFDTGDSDRPTAGNRNNSSGNSNAQWYFYNTTVVSQGRTGFARKWGNRKLEDNWRRSSKEAVITLEDNNRPADTPVDRPTEDSSEQNKARKTQLMAAVPYTKEALDASNKKMGDAYFKLGRIYTQELLEQEKAISTFDTLLVRFPGNEHEAEAFYFMYLIYQDQAQPELQEEYKNKLLAKYPKSPFAKLISNPNYVRDDNLADVQVKELYNSAFELYKGKNYEEASNKISQALNQYPDNVLKDKFTVLKILIIGRTQDKETFKKALNDFVEQNPRSQMLDYVQNILRNTETITGQVNEN